MRPINKVIIRLNKNSENFDFIIKSLSFIFDVDLSKITEIVITPSTCESPYILYEGDRPYKNGRISFISIR